jgi:hypothetical protein
MSFEEKTRITDPYADKNALKRKKGERAPGACDWILDTEEIQQAVGWRDKSSPTKLPKHTTIYRM